MLANHKLYSNLASIDRNNLNSRESVRKYDILKKSGAAQEQFGYRDFTAPN